MIMRSMLVLFKWIAALGLILGFFYGDYRVRGQMQAERAQEGDDDKIQSPRERWRRDLGDRRPGPSGSKGRGCAGNLVVAPSSRLRPGHSQSECHGRGSLSLRRHAAGGSQLRMAGAWPVAPRGSAAGVDRHPHRCEERLALQDNLNSAHLKKQGAEKLVQLQRERVRRIEKVSLSQIVPGQTLDDARALLTDAETQLAIATAATELWRKALEEADRPGNRESTTFSQPLLAPADGEVTELAAHPSMAIEAGGLVAQVVDFRRVLSRLDMPPELIASGPPPRVSLTALSAHSTTLSGSAGVSDAAGPAPPIEAVLVGAAPRVDMVSQLAGYWYATEPERSDGTAEEPGPGSGPAGGAAGAVWRPGLLIKALISPAGAPATPAVSVPAEALLFHQGRTLVYVRQRPGVYRAETCGCWAARETLGFLALRQSTVRAGLSPGEVVVSGGAQMLLSEEFRGDVESD